MDVANGLCQSIETRGFDQVAGGTSLDRLEDRVLVGKAGEDQNVRPSGPAGDNAKEFQTMHARQLQVQEHEVHGQTFVQEGEGAFRRGGLSRHLHVWL